MYSSGHMTQLEEELLVQVAELAAQAAELKKALPPADRLRLLADWFDADDANKGGLRGASVQRDLRKWAQAIEHALMREGSI